MEPEIDLAAVSARIAAMRETAQELETFAGENPCLARNLVRIRASLKMLELEFSDVAELESAD
jgi:23S rRNA A2030 N6-methylase RlmJ